MACLPRLRLAITMELSGNCVLLLGVIRHQDGALLNAAEFTDRAGYGWRHMEGFYCCFLGYSK